MNWYVQAKEAKKSRMKAPGDPEETLCPEVLKEMRQTVAETPDSWNYVTAPDLQKMMKDKRRKPLYLLDVRKPGDFQKGHIEGAENIFWLDLLKPESLKKLPTDRKIVIICYVGHTASQMLFALKTLGYDAVALKFGMGVSPVEGVPVAGWMDYGFDVAKSRS